MHSQLYTRSIQQVHIDNFKKFTLTISKTYLLHLLRVDFDLLVVLLASDLADWVYGDTLIADGGEHLVGGG